MSTPQSNDFIIDCPICLSVLFRPMTLRCGHNFCEQCILTHSFQRKGAFCPVCRSQVVQGLVKHGRNLLLEECVKRLRPEEYHEKGKAWQQIKNQGKSGLKKKMIKKYWTSLSAKISHVTKEIQKWSPLVTLIVILALYFKFRKRLLSDKAIKTTSDEWDNVMENISGNLKKKDGANQMNIMQKIIVSKFIKYLFSSYAKLALI